MGIFGSYFIKFS